MIGKVLTRHFGNRRILVIVLFVVVGFGIPSHARMKAPTGLTPSTKSSNQTEVIERLSRFFGIDRVPARVIHKSPPQFMIDLYASITEPGGLVKRESPYRADVIRSFPDREWRQQMHFYYNVSYLSEGEKLLAAEFHIFKLNPRPSSEGEQMPPHVIEIKVYQVLDPEHINSPQGLKLLDAKRTSAHLHGWFVFQVKNAVNEWINGSAVNYGFLVTTTSSTGRHVNGSYVRFAQRKEHHESKQPILVAYTDDGMARHPSYISPNDENYMQIKKDILKKQRQRMRQFKGKDFLQAVRLLNEREREEDQLRNKHLQSILGTSEHTRRRRSTDQESDSTTSTSDQVKKKKKKLSKEERRQRKQRRREERRRKRQKRKRNKKKGKDKRALDYYRPYRRQRRNCARHQMYVDFDEIGWSGWIISPKGYNAYHCKGACPFPLGQSQKPTNHATVQSIVHALKVGKDVSTPCCVPNKLYSISLLYFDDDENVILKQYDDMVAASCGCH
ncbi:bone morphogenetic protein 7-like [Argopecten irradians]|uniref:bone morphogenetic protein 7-like n=1 Tax=Argopecten irradians TaxID=31199 RepID=UPI00371FA8C8